MTVPRTHARECGHAIGRLYRIPPENVVADGLVELTAPELVLAQRSMQRELDGLQEQADDLGKRLAALTALLAARALD